MSGAPTMTADQTARIGPGRLVLVVGPSGAGKDTLLNLARAETPAAFDGVRRQPEYKAALARGAVELFMPAMPQEVALRIERAQVHFSQARDGEAPEGRKPVTLSLLEQAMVREWLEAMDAEFSVVEGWLPWT